MPVTTPCFVLDLIMYTHILLIQTHICAGLQRRRTMMSPLSPVHRVASSPSLNRHKRSASVDPRDMGSVDRACYRSLGSYDKPGHIQRHMSVENLHSDDMGSEKYEKDHLTRVSDLKAFFENLSKADAKGKGACTIATLFP